MNGKRLRNRLAWEVAQRVFAFGVPGELTAHIIINLLAFVLAGRRRNLRRHGDEPSRLLDYSARRDSKMSPASA